MATTRKAAEQTAPEVSLNIYQKLHLAKQSMGKVIKNATNPHLKRNYADINSIIDTVEPILLDHGLLLMQPIQEDKVYTTIIDIESGEILPYFTSHHRCTEVRRSYHILP